MLKMKRKNSIGANGSYVLALQGEEDYNAAYIQIMLSGEEANAVPCILLAEDKASGEEIGIQGDLIGPISLSSSVVTKINIQTTSQTSYSLGVNVYAY